MSKPTCPAGVCPECGTIMQIVSYEIDGVRHYTRQCDECLHRPAEAYTIDQLFEVLNQLAAVTARVAALEAERDALAVAKHDLCYEVDHWKGICKEKGHTDER
jgi:hypothetical protein